jgi:hypothetical protein
MYTPDDDACQFTSLCFKRGQVADAALIHPALIIDDQNIAGLGGSHCFEEYVHAAIVS